MHVTHVVRQYSPVVGGLENAVEQLVTALKHEGISGSVVTLDRTFGNLSESLPGRETIAGIDVIRIPFRGSSRYPIAPSVLRHIAAADIVHVHGIDFFFDYLAATKLIHRKRLVASTHGGFFHTTYAATAKRLYFNTVTRASALAYAAIIASSASDADRFRAIAAQSTTLIENGVDTRKWAGASSSTYRRSLVYIGRFSENKNILDLVDLVATLRRLNQSWRVDIVGVEGFLSGDDIIAYASSLGVANHIRVHVNKSDAVIREVIGDHSYIASASGYEGFGLSAVEGMAAGLIPVLSHIPPFHKLVASSGCGIVFDPSLAAETARNLETFHNTNAGQFSANRDRAMEFAERYSWDRVGGSFASVYRGLTIKRT